jgi:hypothetical protein
MNVLPIVRHRMLPCLWLLLLSLWQPVATASAYAAYTVQGFDSDPDATFELSPGGLASATGSRGGAYDNGSVYSYLASASASASRGSLHGLLQVTQAGNGFGALTANASVSSTVTFFGSSAREVTLTMDLLGGFFADGGNVGFDASGLIHFGDVSSYGLLQWVNGPGSPLFLTKMGDDVELLSGLPSSMHLRLTVQRTVEPGVPYDIYGGLYLSLQGGEGAISRNDFDHTAQIGIQLPAGLTMQTDGIFLSDLQTVPEPPAWALIALGLGLPGARRWARAPPAAAK